jgi:hypothetical protein
VLAAQFYRLMDTLTRYDVPTTLLQFPRFVSDPDYLFRKLSPVLPDIGAVRFRTAFNQVVRPDLVHDFELNATRG